MLIGLLAGAVVPSVSERSTGMSHTKHSLGQPSFEELERLAADSFVELMVSNCSTYAVLSIVVRSRECLMNWARYDNCTITSKPIGDIISRWHLLHKYLLPEEAI